MKNIRNESGFTVLNFNASSGATGATGAVGGIGPSWMLSGNSGTTGANFLGTNDNTPLLVATNNNLTKATRFNVDGSIEPLNVNKNLLVGTSSSSFATGGGSNNIILSNNGLCGMNGTESNCIIIGADSQNLSFGGQNGVNIIGSASSTRTFIQGVAGHVGGGSLAVLINAYGDMGSLVSSEKYKENIIDMGDESNFIYQLRPVLYNYKDLPNEQSWGLIAEEVFQIKPDVVTKNRDGEIESIQYQYFDAMFINELQKLKKKVDELEQKLIANNIIQ